LQEICFLLERLKQDRRRIAWREVMQAATAIDDDHQRKTKKQKTVRKYPQRKPPTATSTTPNSFARIVPKDIATKTVKQLKELLRERGLLLGGKKEDLGERLMAFQGDETTVEPKTYPSIDAEILKNVNGKELKKLLRERALKLGGRKQAMLDRLLAFQEGRPVQSPSAGRTWKVRFYPDEEQKRRLNNYFGTARWTYNQCVRAVIDKKVDPHSHDALETLRASIVYDSNYYTAAASEPSSNPSDVTTGRGHEDEATNVETTPSTNAHELKWVLDTPSAIRKNVVAEFVLGFKIARKRQRTQPGFRFKMHFRSKKAPQQTIGVPKDMWGVTSKTKFSGVFGYTHLNGISSQPLPRCMDYDFKGNKQASTRYSLMYHVLITFFPLLTQKKKQLAKHVWDGFTFCFLNR